MVFCSGCHRNFKPSGYTLHIQRSRTSACRAAHHEDMHAAGLNDNLSDDSEEVSNFQGDFFGNYEEGDLPWPAETELDEDSEDDHILNADDYMDVETDDYRGGPPNQETSDDYQGADSIFIEYFPSSSAGAAISNHQGFNKTDYDHYRNECGSTTDYAPFASQIDWDVARWAKVHGITATAVTELLGIKGVGFYVIHYV
jgi:hypothetical protein